MNLKEILKESFFEPDNSNSDNPLKQHPKQFISSELKIPVWKVDYSYTTARNNDKTGTKYIFLPEDSWDLIENEFNSYVEIHNMKKPYKAISNVKILDISFIGKIVCPIE